MLSNMQNLRIAKDLILLENQVPFFVLQALFDCTMGTLISSGLSKVLDVFLACYINIFRSGSLLPETTIHVDSDFSLSHVLGYCTNDYQLVVVKPTEFICRFISNKLKIKKGTKNTSRAFHSISRTDGSADCTLYWAEPNHRRDNSQPVDNRWITR
ncbi:putative UPF0481 protein [Tanacetum coccineum]